MFGYQLSCNHLPVQEAVLLPTPAMQSPQRVMVQVLLQSGAGRGPSLARGCVPQHWYQLTVCAGSPQHAHPTTIVSHTPTPDTIFNHLAFWRS